MPEFPAQSPSPARVHPRARELSGHHPHWHRASYRGGLICSLHFRTCSFCGSIHPSDMMALLRSGRSFLEPTAKADKRILRTPNPIAGRRIRMGSLPEPVFEFWPLSLRDRLREPAAADCEPSPAERLAGHCERPLFRPAPDWIEQPFFLQHTTDEQWGEILAAIAQGERHAPSIPSP